MHLGILFSICNALPRTYHIKKHENVKKNQNILKRYEKVHNIIENTRKEIQLQIQYYIEVMVNQPLIC